MKAIVLEQEQLHDSIDSVAIAPSKLYEIIKKDLDYHLEYAEERVEQLNKHMNHELYANCLSTDKYIMQQLKTTSDFLSEDVGYSHHLDKLADYILYASFDNLDDRINSERLREEKKALQKLEDVEKRKKALIVNRDKQTTRLGRLVNKRENRSVAEKYSLHLDYENALEEFYCNQDIEPVHYTKVDKELNQKKVFKNSINYWIHYGTRHNRVGLPSMFSRVSYDTPYYKIAHDSLGIMNDGITKLLQDIESETSKEKKLQKQKLKKELTADYNVAAEILRDRVEPKTGAPSKEVDVLTMHEELIDYADKNVVKAILYSYADLCLQAEKNTTSLQWAITKDFEAALENIVFSSIQKTILNIILHNPKWSFKDIIDMVAVNHNKDFGTNHVSYHINNIINRILHYFIEQTVTSEQ